MTIIVDVCAGAVVVRSMYAVVPSRTEVWVIVCVLPGKVEYWVTTCWTVVVCVLAAKMLV